MLKKIKNMKKTTKSNLITYGIVIVAFVIMQTLISTGSISSLLEGLMVPICIYVILAVSLNLVVGILGELSLGHAGFMCVGRLRQRIFLKMHAGCDHSGYRPVPAGAADRYCGGSSIRYPDRYPGTALKG